ncbi:MAG: GntR family transcriptional regulator, partial [Desulfobacterales bacterium]|nr:GntR family transcriptional regulator [Desulfobacterales bacterium]
MNFTTNFTIDKKLPLSIKEQLKRQIRGMIHSKQLRPGDSLPSCSDMSAILSVNRNTVAAGYAELSSEGTLTTNRGAGTMVSNTTLPEKETSLNAIMNEAFARAAELGFTNEQITDQFFSALAARKPAPPRNILMVWCNPLTIADVGKT